VPSCGQIITRPNFIPHVLCQGGEPNTPTQPRWKRVHRSYALCFMKGLHSTWTAAKAQMWSVGDKDEDNCSPWGGAITRDAAMRSCAAPPAVSIA